MGVIDDHRPGIEAAHVVRDLRSVVIDQKPRGSLQCQVPKKKRLAGRGLADDHAVGLMIFEPLHFRLATMNPVPNHWALRCRKRAQCLWSAGQPQQAFAPFGFLVQTQRKPILIVDLTKMDVSFPSFIA